MATLTADEMQIILNLSDNDISNTNMEYLIDLAINCLNNYGADLPNMNGTAGSKTWSGESKEKGAVQVATRAIHYGFYKGLQQVGFADVSLTMADVFTNATTIQTIKELAQNLVEMDVSVG